MEGGAAEESGVVQGGGIGSACDAEELPGSLACCGMMSVFGCHVLSVCVALLHNMTGPM